MADDTKTVPAAPPAAPSPTAPPAVPTGTAAKAPEVKKTDKSVDDANKASLAAAEAHDAAQVKATESLLTPEQIEAKKAEREAAFKASEAAIAAKNATPAVEESTVESAKVAAPGVDPTLPASHHLAQKFGNDPANPKPADHIPEGYDGPTVRLTRETPDLPRGTYATADVHPDMVGDYLRAGWAKR